MNPKRTFPAMADWRWSRSLQAKHCNNYTAMHMQANIKTKLVRQKPSFVSFLFRCHDPWFSGMRTKQISSVCSVLNYFTVTRADGFPSGSCRNLSKFAPVGKQQIFNRMNGWPGDPPGTHLNLLKPKRIVPFLTRFAGDPIGKEAERETTIGDTKHVNKHINKHGCLTGRIIPRTKQCKTTAIFRSFSQWQEALESN